MKSILRRRRMIRALIQEISIKPKRTRNRNRNKDYYTSNWMQMLDDPMLQDPTNPAAKKFRQRFRVPYPIFVDLLAKAVNLGFELRPVNHAGTEGVPLEVKLLGFLRILGRGTCFDGISELSDASIEVHRSFFHDFTRKFVDRCYHEYVSIPSSETAFTLIWSDFVPNLL
jgi:hypothetical protein